MADTNDPLSTATRATKRNLLVASVLAISANAFNVSIEKIPVAGMSVNFDNRLFGFLILTVLLYFLGTFILYYAIDIKNVARTHHQDESEKAYQSRLNVFPDKYTEQMRKDLRSLEPKGYRLNFLSNFSDALHSGNTNPVTDIRIVERGASSPADFQRKAHEAVFKAIDERFDYWVKGYKKAAAANARRATLVIESVRLMYFTRNYFVDGVLPIILGVIALLAILGVINLHWMQDLFPRFKFHSTPGK
jgi:hypothetical protein